MSQQHAMDLFSSSSASRETEAYNVPGRSVAKEPVAREPAERVTRVPTPRNDSEMLVETTIAEEEKPAATRTPGRPRSEASRNAILDATRRMALHTSVRDLSIEAIAKKAGVGKTTIYRWWPNKVAVVIEAFADQMDMISAAGSHETPSETLLRQMDRLIRQLRSRTGKIIADLMAEAQSDAKVMAQFNEFYMNARRQMIYDIIFAGQKSGEFTETMNTDMVVDLVLGPVFFRLMGGEGALDDHFTSRYPDIMMAAIRT